MNPVVDAVGQTMSSGEEITFWICGTLAVMGALGLILSRKPVHSALFVALTMINLAILYAANDAVFLGLVQVIVYTGAVMMLFLFVLMLIGVDSSDSLVETLKGQRIAAVVLVAGFVAVMVIAIGGALANVTTVGLEDANAASGGNVEGLARLMFTKYLVDLEVVAALLITAALGALILTHRERWAPRRGQREMAQDRIAAFAEGQHPGALPVAGVLATSNAIGTPALLPDGSISEASVPVPLRGERRSRLSTTAGEIAADIAEVAEISVGEEAVRSEELAGIDGHVDSSEVYPPSEDETGTWTEGE
ncbi:MAG: NADH-quinone oxidoreductase subunit J [Candidatus Nanopelagicales bacterium]|nr:NADH-quinone oxidoreductase subunit J [Candidatus Nanopelagicales bacterium]